MTFINRAIVLNRDYFL